MNKNNKKTVRNKGKRIGELFSYVSNIKRVLIFASHIMKSENLYSLKEREISYPMTTSNIGFSYVDEPTYNLIPYVVSSGDTLIDIVYSYEKDKEKALANLKLIEEYNKIDGENIPEGETIFLIGVPASKLEQFGFIDNYNYFEPTVEIDLRLEFLNKVVNQIAKASNCVDFAVSVRNIEQAYNEYNSEYDEDDEYKLDYIINSLRDLCVDAKEYGFSFENNLKALPVSEADYYETHKSY